MKINRENMRNIKFEYGFKNINGIVKKHYYLYEIPNIKKICDVWNNLPIVYVKQYTGINDKNNEEIYEGDKVKVHIFVEELGENLGVQEGEKEFEGIVSIDPLLGFCVNGEDLARYYGYHEESLELVHE